MTNTALGAQIEQVQIRKVTNNPITFKNEEHKEFYFQYLQKCRRTDVYHKALVYTLGISRDTREHVDSIYDFETGYVKTDCLHDPWITSGSVRVVRLAYNLYCNGTPNVFDYDENSEEALTEAGRYTVEELFCCGYAPYFWQAVKIRYPEYCQGGE